MGVPLFKTSMKIKQKKKWWKTGNPWSWKWGAITKYYASHAKTMLPMRKSVPRSSRQSVHKMISWPLQKMKTEVVWTCLKFIRSGQDHLARCSDRREEDKADRKRVGRQHQGMDRPGVFQTPEGSGEQRKWRKLFVKSSVVPQWPPWLRDRWQWRWRWRNPWSGVHLHEHMKGRFPKQWSHKGNGQWGGVHFHENVI